MSVDGKVLMSLVMLAIFVAMVAIAATYPPDTRFLPFVIGIPGIVLALIQVASELADARREAPGAKPGPDASLHEKAEAAAHGAYEQPPVVRQEIVLLAYLVGLAAAVLLLGFWLAVPLFVIAFLRFHERETWTLTLSLTAGAWAVLYLMFDSLLGIIVHEGFLTQYILG